MIFVWSVKVLFKWFVFCLSLELLHPYLPCGFKDLVCSIADVKMMYLVIMCSICSGSNSGFSGSRKAMQAASAALKRFCSSFNLHKWCVRFLQWITTSQHCFLLGGFALYVMCSLGTSLFLLCGKSRWGFLPFPCIFWSKKWDPLNVSVDFNGSHW